MRALSVEDKAEKKKAKKERQRVARAQAAARHSPTPAAGSSAAQQLRSSVQRSSPPSLELPAAEQKPSSTAQAGAPTKQAVLQAAEHCQAELAEALPQPASGEGMRQRKGQGTLNRSGTLPSGRVHSAPAEEATSPGVPGSNFTAASPGYQTSKDQAADEHVSALSSPAEHLESSASALCGSLLALRLHHPIHKVTFAAHQPQSGGSGMPRPHHRSLAPPRRSPGRRSGLAGASQLQRRQLPKQARVAVEARRCQRHCPDQQLLRQ